MWQGALALLLYHVDVGGWKKRQNPLCLRMVCYLLPQQNGLRLEFLGSVHDGVPRV